jgi:2-polyprenyl-3-methyl-5-hydroxy-6-metoxy-1,4-benzoquinol methylase
VAEAVAGIDIDSDSVARLQAIGIPNLVVGDVEECDLSSIAPDAEVVVAGELLEHLQNPGRAMLRIRSLIAKTGGVLVISVPNAFSLYNILSIALCSRELVLNSHNVYYSPITLGAFVGRCGFAVRELRMYSDASRARGFKWAAKQVYLRTVLHVIPYYSEGLIAVCGVLESATLQQG